MKVNPYNIRKLRNIHQSAKKYFNYYVNIQSVELLMYVGKYMNILRVDFGDRFREKRLIDNLSDNS
jgi:hypothetical protein